MVSTLPKVLHPIGGQPMISHVLDAVSSVVPHVPIAVVVGHGKEKVESVLRSEERWKELDLHTVEQSEPKGTGDAVRCAMNSRWGAKVYEDQCAVLVLPGDQPLISTALIAAMVEPLEKASIRMLTCELDDPTGYGRVVRQGKEGPVQKIIEQKDATPKQQSIKEVANSIYLFEPGFLKQELPKLSNQNKQGEYYLTDLIQAAVRKRKKIEVLKWKNSEELRGVNDLWELSAAGRLLRERILKHWALAGVNFIDPSRVEIEASVRLSPGVVVYPGATLQGKTQIGEGTEIGPGCVLKDARIGAYCKIKAGSVIEDSSIGDSCNVGPYAHLRPDSHVGKESKIGNFVELKNSSIGSKTSIAHLSYVGDADVGSEVNIGCGFITCNFDGRVIEGSRKHRTVIEDRVFMGSDCQAIAPIRIGRGAYVASGSTLTKDVEPDALAIARSPQVIKAGYARRLREG